MLYLDSSAFLKLFLNEEGSTTVYKIVTSQDYPIPVWDLQEMEMLNAFQFKIFLGQMTPEDAEFQTATFDKSKAQGHYFFPEINRPELSYTFRELSKKTAELGCRTLDIMHVACALQLEPTAFISFDQRQRTLASRAGLNVLPETI